MLEPAASIPILELEVANDSASVVAVEVLGPDGADAGIREVVLPLGGIKFAVERPAPGGWSVTVDGRTATDWHDWEGSRVIDLRLVIKGDGSVEVQDP